MAYAAGSLLELGDGVFRKVRAALGVTAFGVNGLVLEPGQGWFEHFHDHQDELYFVHRGRAGFEVDGATFELEPGGLCHVESTTPRRVWNAGDDELILLIVGGEDGYVGRDGHMMNLADEELRRSVASGETSAIPRSGASA